MLQITFEEENYNKKCKLNDAVTSIKQKYGNKSVVKGIVLKDKKFFRQDEETHHEIHPDGKL